MADVAARSGRRRWPWLLGGLGVVSVVAVVAIGWFGVHTLFFDDVVDEAGPVFESGAGADVGEAGEPGAVRDDGDDGDDGEQGAPTTTDAPQVATLAGGTFEGVGRYSGAGTAVVLGDGTGQRFVRFEDDFRTDNGPDLFVYLGTGSGEYDDPGQYLELGTLAGNVGAQNYEIPEVHPQTGEPVDLERFDHVAVWCKRFSATFAIAPLDLDTT